MQDGLRHLAAAGQVEVIIQLVLDLLDGLVDVVSGLGLDLVDSFFRAPHSAALL